MFGNNMKKIANAIFDIQRFFHLEEVENFPFKAMALYHVFI